MSWGPNSVLARPLIALGLLATATAAMADILVVRSSGPSARSYPAGRRLPESSRLSLKAGDQLIVLDGRGTRVIRGPGSFAAGAPAVGRVASAAPVQRRARIGAVRGIETGELRPPSIWHVDVARSSNVCVADPAKVTLWRARAAEAATLSIAARNGATRQLGWQPGSSTLAWPSDLPVAEGAEYRLSGTGAAAPTTIRFRTMPAKPAGLEDMAQALIRNQCDAQLDLFIDTVKLPG
ncbi:MAG TPA: hypothetical protein VF547_07810 [Allosphingosinicella sp.]